MKKHKYVLRVLIVFLFMASLFMPTSAATATKVKSQLVRNGYKEHRVITGYTSKGKKVWTWKSRTYEMAQIDSSYYVVKGSYVYVIERGRYVRIKKSNGKVMKTRNTSYAVPGPAIAVDSSGYLYNAGYLDNKIVKFNKSGLVVAKRTVSQSYDYWPYKIKFSGKKVKVYYEMYGHVLTVKKSNLK